MNKISRRSMVWMFGATVVAGELFSARPSKAFFYIRDADGSKNCNAVKGNITYFESPVDDRIGYCDTPNDLACMETLGNKEAVYDHNTHQCKMFDQNDYASTNTERPTVVVEGHTGNSDETDESGAENIIEYLNRDAGISDTGSNGEGLTASEAAYIPCFLTTACAENIGLPDDCFELQTLRSFRDRIMLGTDHGRQDVELYYRDAPVLVSRIARSPNARAELARAYFLYILPCVVLVRLRLHSLAYRTYRAMMRDLPARLTAQGC